jgi:hypothetical protein
MKKITVQTTPERARTLQRLINDAESGTVVGTPAARPVGLANAVVVEVRDAVAASEYGQFNAHLMRLNGGSWEDTGQIVLVRKITEVAIDGTDAAPVRMIARPVSNLGLCVEIIETSGALPYYERPQQFCCGRCLDSGVRTIGTGEAAKEAPSGYGVHVPVMLCCPNCDTEVGGDTAAALSDVPLDLRYESATGLYVSDEADCGDTETVRWEFDPLTGTLEYKEQTSGVVLGTWSTSVVDPNPLCPYRLTLESVSGLCYYCGESVCVKPYVEADAECTSGYCTGVQLPPSLEVVLGEDLEEDGDGSLDWQYIEDGGLGPDTTWDYTFTWPHASTITGKVVNRLITGYNADGSPQYGACEWWGGEAFWSRYKWKNTSAEFGINPCRYNEPNGAVYVMSATETVPHTTLSDIQGTSAAHGGSGSPWSSCPVSNSYINSCAGVRWGWTWKVYLTTVSTVLKLRVELIRKVRVVALEEKIGSGYPSCDVKRFYVQPTISWAGKPTLDFVVPSDSNLGGAIIARWEVSYDCGEGPWTLTKTFDTYETEPTDYAITNLPSTIVVKGFDSASSPSDPRHCMPSEEPPPPPP